MERCRALFPTVQPTNQRGKFIIHTPPEMFAWAKELLRSPLSPALRCAGLAEKTEDVSDAEASPAFWKPLWGFNERAGSLQHLVQPSCSQGNMEPLDAWGRGPGLDSPCKGAHVRRYLGDVVAALWIPISTFSSWGTLFRVALERIYLELVGTEQPGFSQPG